MANFSNDPYDLLDDEEEKEEDPEEAVEKITGDKPTPGKPFSIADEVEKDEKAKYDIPPVGSDIPKKPDPKLDELEGPSDDELEEIELEEEFGGKD